MDRKRRTKEVCIHEEIDGDEKIKIDVYYMYD
jgi:hypothetical protein